MLFDLDGTLVDSRATMFAAFETAYRAVGGVGRAPCEGLLAMQGQPLATILESLSLPPEMQPVFVTESREQIHRSRLYEGVREMLAGFRALGLNMAVATGKQAARARFVLDHFALTEYFDLVVGSDDVANGKPAPDMLYSAMERIGVGAESALMIGDALADLEAAANAGIPFILAGWGYCEKPLPAAETAATAAEASALVLARLGVSPSLAFATARAAYGG
ncbi:MAG TPA: HAD-IA family hydrolase [Allosphingosinicella sp.]|nr:HAD-IA family hydrolase [Allosphingosinicella sp.]